MAVDYDIDLDALLRTHCGDPHGLIPMIGYLRVSTAREDMISPDLQADHIDRLARTTGRRIVRWYADLDLSGRTLKKRQISSIIDGIATGTSPEKAKEVGVWKFSRFGRNRADNAFNLARLEAAGGSLISATEPVDASTAVGRFNRNILMDVAELEGDLIGENWKDAQAYRRRAGLPNSGRPRFGYVRRGRIQVAPGYWVTDPTDPLGERYEPAEHAPALRRMYEEAADGRSGFSIVRWLNASRIPGPSGTVGRWSHSTLWPLLDSGFGAGYIRQHDPECTVHDRTTQGWCRNWAWIVGAHPHLWAHLPDGDATRDRIWKAYRARRESATPPPPRAVEARHELSQTVSCGWCGTTMTANRFKPGSDLYTWRCPGRARGVCTHTNTISDRRCRAVVRDLLTREHRRLAVVEAEAAPHDVVPPEAGPDRGEEVAAALEALQRKLDRVADQYVAEDIPPESYRRLRDRYLAEQAELREEHAELQGARAAAEEQVDYVAVTRGLLEEWETLPVWSVNKVLKSLLSIEAKRYTRTEAWITIRTAWGAEERFPAAEPKGRASKSAGQ
ncbi:recombinase family protein [Nocardiopsis synnemataformans]|uniref:recombinase family protein n=1 Tax=Nocardiopsis synnemataformans TaxID=61305 RepID=UPI003EC01B33